MWIFTFGIIPEIHQEACIGYRFTLERAGLDKAEVDVPMSQTVVFGWIATPLNLFPSWGLSAARHRDAAIRQLAIAVLRTRTLQPEERPAE